MITSHPQFRRADREHHVGQADDGRRLWNPTTASTWPGSIRRTRRRKPWTLQPTNPELLQAMAEDFGKHNYSLQHVDQDDHEVERVSALVAIPRRMEVGLRALLCAPVSSA